MHRGDGTQHSVPRLVNLFRRNVERAEISDLCDEGSLVQIAAIVEITDLDKLGDDLRIGIGCSKDTIVKRVDVHPYQHVTDIEEDGHEELHYRPPRVACPFLFSEASGILPVRAQRACREYRKNRGFFIMVRLFLLVLWGVTGSVRLLFDSEAESPRDV